MFNIDLEISKSCPIGMAIGMVVGFVVEFLRQKEIENRPRGKNSLESLLDNYYSPSIPRSLKHKVRLCYLQHADDAGTGIS
jgi:hypothetical protein